MISSLSIIDIYRKVIDQNPDQFKYLLTYKMSQDHIELFFNAIRARSGWCVNPTPRHFSAAYKKLLMHHCVKSSGGNVESVDKTAILFTTRVPVCKFEDTLPNNDTLSISNDRKFKELLNDENTNIKEDNITCLPDFDIDHNREIQKELYDIGLEMPPNYFVLSEFSENAVALVAGYVIRMVSYKYI